MRFGHQERYDCAEVKASLQNCTYLEDELVEIEGIRIYGSPWQPEFCDWAFNLPRCVSGPPTVLCSAICRSHYARHTRTTALAARTSSGEPCLEKWKMIPSDVDVLITHGPPLGTVTRPHQPGHKLTWEKIHSCHTSPWLV